MKRKVKHVLQQVVAIVVILSIMGNSIGHTLQPARVHMASSESEPMTDFPTIELEQPLSLGSASAAAQGTPTTYLPLVMRGYDPLLERFDISAASGGVFKTENGMAIRVLPGAFPQDGYLFYKPLLPVTAPAGMQITPLGFELRSFTNDGQELHQFSNSIVGRIPYDYTDFVGGDEKSLAVYYFDEQEQIWQSLDSQVDYHRSQIVLYDHPLYPVRVDGSTFGLYE